MISQWFEEIDAWSTSLPFRQNLQPTNWIIVAHLGWNQVMWELPENKRTSSYCPIIFECGGFGVSDTNVTPPFLAKVKCSIWLCSSKGRAKAPLVEVRLTETLPLIDCEQTVNDLNGLMKMNSSGSNGQTAGVISELDLPRLMWGIKTGSLTAV